MELLVEQNSLLTELVKRGSIVETEGKDTFKVLSPSLIKCIQHLEQHPDDKQLSTRELSKKYGTAHTTWAKALKEVE